MRARVVPKLGAARALLWAALGAIALLTYASPAEFGPVQLAAGEDGCRLTTARAARACPCAELSGTLRLLFGLPIPLNLARARDLQAIRGIGPGRAAAIVAERQATGPYTDVDSLLRVTGIGPATLEQLRPFVITAAADPACDAEGIARALPMGKATGADAAGAAPD